MKQLHTEKITAITTTDAAMTVDGEVAVNKEQLQELIQKESAKNTKALWKELTALKQTINNMAKTQTGTAPPSAPQTSQSRAPKQRM